MWDTHRERWRWARWELRSECFYLEVVSQAREDRKRWTFELGECPEAFSPLSPQNPALQGWQEGHNRGCRGPPPTAPVPLTFVYSGTVLLERLLIQCAWYSFLIFCDADQLQAHTKPTMPCSRLSQAPVPYRAPMRVAEDLLTFPRLKFL